MKKLLFVFVLSTLLFTYGCSKKTIDTNVDTTTEITTEDTAVDHIEEDVSMTDDLNNQSDTQVVVENTEWSVWAPSCDRYITFMHCVYGKMEFWSEQFQWELMKLKQTRANEPDKSALEDSCRSMVRVLEEEQGGMQDGCQL